MKILIAIIFAVIVGCTQANIEANEIEEETDEVVSMKLTSPAFGHGKEIPSEYTCDGADVSPELNIIDVPENAKSLALIMDDPDAPVGTFVHWVVWDIPASAAKMEKGQKPEGKQGKTGFGKTGYGGPCPPSGSHRYFFKLYALDSELELEEGSSKADLENAMEGHIIEKAELMGTYQRK